MVLTIIISLYILGYVLSYLWLRTIVRDKEGGDWILLEKIVVCTISLLSWVAILAVVFLIILSPVFKIDVDKKCKW